MAQPLSYYKPALQLAHLPDLTILPYGPSPHSILQLLYTHHPQCIATCHWNRVRAQCHFKLIMHWPCVNNMPNTHDPVSKDPDRNVQGLIDTTRRHC